MPTTKPKNGMSVKAYRGDAKTLLADPRLEDWGIEPPSSVRIQRAAQRSGVHLPAEQTT